MKKLILTPILALLFAGGLMAQNWPDEYLGLPGDNLNLFAVMNLFQESETLEGFERSLNDPESMINNLDLNGDNYVDYIMVFDYVEDNVHTIVLRVALNQNEYQDVAVFTVERFRDGSVQVQLIGDEALYGPNYIVEPNYAETPNPGYRGNVTQTRSRNVTVIRTTHYEVAQWPVIVYISRPVYRPWRSVYFYGYYPVYWRPWTPHYWHFYYGYHYNWHAHYYSHFRPWRYHRCRSYHRVYYTSIRNYSPTIVVNINKGTFRNTYSRPDTRQQGEVLYTQRHNTGGTVGRNTAVNSITRREASQSASSGNARVARQENTRRAEASLERTNRNASMQSTETQRRQEATVNTGRENRGQAVQSNTTRPATAARPATEAIRNTDRRVDNSRENRSEVVQRSSSNNRSSGTSVQRSSSNNRSSGTSVQRSSSNNRSSGTSVQRSSSNNRSSGTSVQRSSGNNNRSSGTSVQKSQSNNNQRSVPAREQRNSRTPSRR